MRFLSEMWEVFTHMGAFMIGGVLAMAATFIVGLLVFKVVNWIGDHLW